MSVDQTLPLRVSLAERDHLLLLLIHLLPVQSVISVLLFVQCVFYMLPPLEVSVKLLMSLNIIHKESRVKHLLEQNSKYYIHTHLSCIGQNCIANYISGL